MKTSLIWQTHLPITTSLSSAHDLMQSESLTHTLTQLNADFSVELLHLGENLAGDWFADLNLPSSGFCRDVYLCLDKQAVVWARSFCALQAQQWQHILNCGSQSLGKILFSGDLALTRSPIMYADLSAYPHHNAVIARRSVFHLKNEPLALVECFLPSLAKFFQ